MASGYEVEVTITSAKDLKNVNWRHGPLRPYSVVWVDPKSKCSTRVDEQGDDSPFWDQRLLIPLNNDCSINDAVLHVDIVHADPGKDTKPLIGSARLPLRRVVDEVGFGQLFTKNLQLERPSGRPHGKVTLKIFVRQPPRYYPSYPQPAYCVSGSGSGSRDYYAPPPLPQPYGYSNPTPSTPYQQPVGYQYGDQNYGQASYGQGGGYGYGEPQPQPQQPVEKKKSKYGGMGTGLAVGALAGVLGGLAIAEGVDYVEDKIAEDAADKVEDDLGYDDYADGGDDW